MNEIKILAEEYKTLVILDWDDTCFPSWEFSQLKHQFQLEYYTEMAQEVYAHLPMKELEEELILFAKMVETTSNCKMIIVTNADYEWVSLSCRLFMPRFWNAMADQKTEAYSARDNFASQFPDDPYSWKQACMFECVDLERDFSKMISIGDAPNDETISSYVAHRLQKPCNFIRFQTYPSVDLMVKQWQNVRSKWDSVSKFEQGQVFNLVKLPLDISL